MTEVRAAIVTTGRATAARPATGELAIPGRPGDSADHGYAVYGEAAMAPVITLDAGVREVVTFSATVSDNLVATSPYAKHLFWDGAKIRPRKAGDTAILRLDLTSTSLVSNGSIEIQLDIGPPFGVIQQVSRALKAPAGQVERISEAFPIYMGATFVANGGSIYLQSSVPSLIAMVSLIVFPLSAAS